MGKATGSLVPGYDELATLKLLALDGGLQGEVKVSCSDLGDRLDASSQTASRRLQTLDDAGLVTRETVSDGQWVALTGDGERALKREYEDYRRVFEGRADLALVGSVTSGMGEGRHYISLSGYMEQFVDRLDYEPFPGTLNVTLTPESRRERAALEAFESVPIDGWEGDGRTFGPAACYPASVESGGERYEPAHVIVPVRTHHDEGQLELIAPEKLRAVLDLADGDEVTVDVEEP